MMSFVRDLVFDLGYVQELLALTGDCLASLVLTARAFLSRDYDPRGVNCSHFRDDCGVSYPFYPFAVTVQESAMVTNVDVVFSDIPANVISIRMKIT